MSGLILPGQKVSDLFRGLRLEVPGADPGVLTNNIGTATSSNPNTNTKGLWAEETAGLTVDTYGILLQQQSNPLNNRSMLMDIGVGGAGSEVVLVGNIFFTMGGTNPYSWDTHHIPIFIRRGTRVAVRHQDTTNASDTQSSRLYFLNYPVFRPPICRTCETYGAITSGDSAGTSIDPGGSASTKSGYVQLIASTAKRVRWLTIMVGGANSTRSDYSWQLDIATGAGGSESILIADLNIRSSALFTVPAPGVFGPFPVDIPAGTRISASASCSGTDATDRLIQITGYGFSP